MVRDDRPGQFSRIHKHSFLVISGISMGLCGKPWKGQTSPNIIINFRRGFGNWRLAGRRKRDGKKEGRAARRLPVLEGEARDGETKQYHDKRYSEMILVLDLPIYAGQK